MDFDHHATTTRLAREIKEELTGIETSECMLDAMGESDCDCDQSQCANRALDENGKWYCRVERARDLEQQKEESAWLSSMLPHYWANGVGSQDVEFLEINGFVTRYKYVARQISTASLKNDSGD